MVFGRPHRRRRKKKKKRYRNISPARRNSLYVTFAAMIKEKGKINVKQAAETHGMAWNTVNSWKKKYVVFLETGDPMVLGRKEREETDGNHQIWSHVDSVCDILTGLTPGLEHAPEAIKKIEVQLGFTVSEVTLSKFIGVYGQWKVPSKRNIDFSDRQRVERVDWVNYFTKGRGSAPKKKFEDSVCWADEKFVRPYGQAKFQMLQFRRHGDTTPLIPMIKDPYNRQKLSISLLVKKGAKPFMYTHGDLHTITRGPRTGTTTIRGGNVGAQQALKVVKAAHRCHWFTRNNVKFMYCDCGSSLHSACVRKYLSSIGVHLFLRANRDNIEGGIPALSPDLNPPDENIFSWLQRQVTIEFKQKIRDQPNLLVDRQIDSSILLKEICENIINKRAIRKVIDKSVDHQTTVWKHIIRTNGELFTSQF